jgi:hypothetical protein
MSVYLECISIIDNSPHVNTLRNPIFKSAILFVRIQPRQCGREHFILLGTNYTGGRSNARQRIREIRGKRERANICTHFKSNIMGWCMPIIDDGISWFVSVAGFAILWNDAQENDREISTILKLGDRFLQVSNFYSDFGIGSQRFGDILHRACATGRLHKSGFQVFGMPERTLPQFIVRAPKSKCKYRNKNSRDSTDSTIVRFQKTGKGNQPYLQSKNEDDENGHLIGGLMVVIGVPLIIVFAIWEYHRAFKRR